MPFSSLHDYIHTYGLFLFLTLAVYSYIKLSLDLFASLKAHRFEYFANLITNISIVFLYSFVFGAIAGFFLGAILSDQSKISFVNIYFGMIVAFLVIVGAMAIRAFSPTQKYKDLFYNLIIMLQTTYSLAKFGPIVIAAMGLIVLLINGLGPFLGQIIYWFYKRVGQDSKIELEHIQALVSYGIIYPIIGVAASFFMVLY